MKAAHRIFSGNKRMEESEEFMTVLGPGLIIGVGTVPGPSDYAEHVMVWYWKKEERSAVKSLENVAICCMPPSLQLTEESA